MTLKQKKFIKKYIETGNGTQAALEAYDTTDPDTAAVIASENLIKPKVVEEITRVLNRKGLSLEQVSESVGNIIRNGPQTKITGDNVLRAAEMAFKLHNAFPAEKSTHVRVNLKAELSKMSYSELLESYRKRDKEIKELMDA